MRIESQNRWSCIALLAVLAALAGLAIWLITREPGATTANEVQGDIDGPAAPQAPAAAAPPPAGN